jgi:dihydropyrimidine dehydrogenase (NAD+) subunit PreT
MVQSSFPVQQLANPSTEVDAYSRIRTNHATSRIITKPAHSRIKQLDWLLFALFILGTGALLLRGWQFYTLAVGERVDHPDFRVLGPSTSLGRAYGIAGTVMIFTNLLYLVRRRFARLGVGSLRAWLDIHTFTGLFGGLLVVFHSAFQVRSSIAVITISSLFIVILTGIIGRSLYSLTPRPNLARLELQLSVLDRVGPGMGQVLRQRIDRVARTAAPARASLLGVLLAWPAFRREARQRRVTFDRTVADYAGYFGRELRQLGRPLAECRRIYVSQVNAVAAEALLRSWRGVHRLSALLMVSLVVMHIAIAWYYGFIWAVSH